MAEQPYCRWRPHFVTASTCIPLGLLAMFKDLFLCCHREEKYILESQLELMEKRVPPMKKYDDTTVISVMIA